MKNNFRILLSIFILSAGIAAHAQDHTIKGKVTTFGKIPLKNVAITTSKTNQTAYTDSLGLFSIQCSEKDRLQVSADGFDGVKLKFKDLKPNTNIDLVYSNQSNSFTDATQNGHISEEALKSAIKTYPLKGEKDYSNYSNIFQLIDGEIFNVDVNGNKVTSKGQSSFTGGQEVLFVVDGAIISDVSIISPVNVKSIKFLDGAQASIYGSRGGAGVIEIKLKK